MTIRWGHVAVARRSESESDRFFVELLGLEKSRVRELAPELAERIFARAVGCTMIDYRSGDVRFEVFVPRDGELAPRGFAHVCLALDDREALADRCSEAGVLVRRVPRDGADILFLEDGDGNLYEIQDAG